MSKFITSLEEDCKIIGKNVFINSFYLVYYMAATPPGPQKMRIDYNIDRKIYDEFAKSCSRKGFAPQVVIEKLMKKFTETGQV